MLFAAFRKLEKTVKLLLLRSDNAASVAPLSEMVVSETYTKVELDAYFAQIRAKVNVLITAAGSED